MSCFATFATVLLAGFSNRQGCSFYFSSQSASTSLLRPAGCGLLRSSSAPSSDFRRFFSKGSGFYFSAAFPVNLLAVSFLHR
ncbi:hypothetical protein, partial [Corallococcus caeni]|uniref:hypothetical protein n=1 Tax=Corallococcus caeni TaxID=3082388 RepID=UPI0030C71EE7